MSPSGTDATPHPDPAAGLNEAQRRAVAHDAGPLIVLAGPGTGKTRVITHRVERLITGGAAPESILAVTYTVKAAQQLRERLATLVGAAAADRLHAHTFHGLGLRLVQRFADELALPPTLRLIDSAQCRRLLRELIRAHNLFKDLLPAGRDTVIGEVIQTISSLSDHAVFPDRAAAFARAWSQRLARPAPDAPPGDDAAARAAEREHHKRFAEIAALYAHFRAECAARGWVTFDELILRAVELLSKRPTAAAIMQGEIRHVVVDEFQDVNAAQIALLKLLCPPAPPNAPDLCVVGDDDQSIYEFRGADDRAFARFAEIWPAHTTITLSENYRSQPPIIDAANAVMARADHRFAPDKVVERPRGAPSEPAPGAALECITLDHNDHAGEVAAALILADRRRAAAAGTPRPFSAFAVIARSHSDLDRIGAALQIEGIPVRRSRNPSALDDRGVQDLLRWVELLASPGASPLAAYAAHWILTRPPFSIPTSVVGEWAIDYRALASRARLRAADIDDQQHQIPFAPPIPSFAAYAAERARATPHDKALRRFLALESDLRDAASRATADQALFDIIRSTDVAHAELLPARQRARRVAHLAEILRSVRARLDILDPPHDLRAFWAYYQDLSEDERAFRGEPADRVDGEDAEDPDQPDAVSLLTAHSAKGLEFDTVILPKVRPGRGGYPSSGDDRPQLPEGLVDRGDDTRTIGERRAAEERRLFYVAATRAERRLILLAQHRKARTASTDFFNEIALDEPCCRFALRRTADEVLADAAAAGVSLSARSGLDAAAPDLAAGRGTPEDRRAILDRARAQSRLAAADALDAIDRPDAAPADLDQAAARLRDAAQRLAIAAHIDARAAAPAWVPETPLAAFAQDLAARAAKATGEPAPASALFKPLEGPLTLSYSWIEEYHRCPRCFYLRRILRFPEPEGKPQVVGTAAHQALAQFYQRLRLADSGEAAARAPSLADLLALGKQEFLRLIPAKAEADPEQLAQLLAQLSLAHEKLIDPAAEVHEIEHPFRFTYPRAGALHRFEAKIDRLDRLPPPARGHRIVDYKTGKPREKITHPAPTDLQMGIYAMALRRYQDGLGPDEGPADEAQLLRPAEGVAEYWVLATGERGSLNLASLDYEKVKAQVDAAIDGMLAGRFQTGNGCWGLCLALAGPDPAPPG